MMLNRQLANLKLDNVLKGYRLIKSIDVTEYKMTALEFVHEKTNAKHIHLMREDRNKTFGVLFRTPPPNSSGVPHILEHTVLCGSDKYPVRDPFFKMLTRSQATFMNAMTANDWTLYPFSSMNKTDFFNLLSVYMDAVFKPKLEEQDFMQEGWRLEPQNMSDSASKFLLKGVVYNEMKGVFSSSINNLSYEVEKNMLPKTYPYISGGDPMSIPSLSHSQLKQFHSKLYHPSNCKFFTYGDVDLEEAFDKINGEYLQHFTKIKHDTSIPLEPKWKSAKTLDIHCQSDPMVADPERQSSVAISFAINDSKEVYLNFAMGLVSSLLLNGDNAPLYQALIESGIGQDWIGNLCGFDNANRTTLFHIGLQGVHNSDVDKVEKILLGVLNDVVQKGFPKQRIESLIHQIELGLRHDNPKFGLRLIMGLSSPVNHDASLEDSLKSLEYVKRIKNDLSVNSAYLTDLVKIYLLNNTHRLTVRMSPKETFESEKFAEENKLVEELNKNLSASDKSEIMSKCQKLLDAQHKTENVNCLPCLQISDIPEQCERYPFKMSDVHQCQINEYDTNGILYLKMLFNLNGIDADLLPYLPLLSSVFTSMSTSTMHYREIDQAAESCSGGLSASLHLSGNFNSLGSDDMKAGFVLSSHCLYTNTIKMLELWSNLIHEVKFDDTERLSTLIRMESTGSWSADGISGSAHSFAMRRAAASLSPSGRLSEFWNGLEQAKLMKSLANMSPESLGENIVPKLIKLKDMIFNMKRLKFAINLESSAVDQTLSLLKLFKDELKAEKFKNIPISINDSVENRCQLVLPYTVNYVSTAIKSVPYQHPDYAGTRVLSRLLSSKFLHKQIREIGGAYGGGVVSSPGHWSFYSYRDPHSSETLQTFDKSLDWIIQEDISKQLLDEAKLSVFQDVDKPISAGSKGLSHFYDGVTDEIRQQQRDGLFQVTIQSLKNIAETLKNCTTRSSVIIGPDQEMGVEWKKILFNK